MNVGLYRSAVAMMNHQRHMESIAGNLANLGTRGFKRGGTAFHGIELRGNHGPIRGLASRYEIDFSQGNLHRTGRELDLALQGEGFFAVESPNGEVYTRDGVFHMSEGVLVNDKGYPVAWEGDRAVLDPAGLPVVVDEFGTLRQGGNSIGQLKIVNFQDPNQLRQDRNGFWVAQPGAEPATSTANVVQYALEESNATGVEEMIAMIGVQRSFETVANTVQSIAESYQRLTRPF